MVNTLTAPFPWKPARHAAPVAWPSLGGELIVDFTAPPTADPNHQDVVISVHYELLQGAPVLSKWLSISRAGGAATHTQATDDDRHHHHGRNTTNGSMITAVPPDQQGPVNIESCSYASPPSNWDMGWILDTPHQHIRIGASSASNCLTAVLGTASNNFAPTLLLSYTSFYLVNSRILIGCAPPPPPKKKKKKRGVLSEVPPSAVPLPLYADVRHSGDA